MFIDFTLSHKSFVLCCVQTKYFTFVCLALWSSFTNRQKCTQLCKKPATFNAGGPLPLKKKLNYPVIILNIRHFNNSGQ
jgi:hypothetical protein